MKTRANERPEMSYSNRKTRRFLTLRPLTTPTEIGTVGETMGNRAGVATQDGARLMSSALPRTASAIETWMGELLA